MARSRDPREVGVKRCETMLAVVLALLLWAAPALAEDDYQASVENPGCKFDAAELRLRHDVASDPYDEQVAQSLVEHDLDRDPGIGAAYYDGERGLVLR